MTPQWLQAVLIGEYLILAAWYGWWGDPAKALYWVGASLLATAVLLMG